MDIGKVVIVEGPDKGLVTVLSESGKTYIVGRGKGTEIKLTDLQASRAHAMFLRKSDKYYCSDLQSRNGTIVNGKVIEGERELRPGDRVTVGGTTLEFQYSDEQQAREIQTKAAHAPTPKASPSPAPVSLAATDPHGDLKHGPPANSAEGDEELVEVAPLESGITNIIKTDSIRPGSDRPVADAPAPRPAAKAAAPAKPAAPAKTAAKAETAAREPGTSKAPPRPAATAKPARPPSAPPAKPAAGKGKKAPGKSGHGDPRERDVIPASDSKVLQSLDQLDLKVAQLALDAEYVNEKQIGECSRIQKTSLNRVGLGLVLVERGYIDFESLSSLCQMTGADSPEQESLKNQDFLFGRLCVQMALISPNQLNECMMLQGKRLRDDDFKLLGALMVEKGFVSEGKVKEVLRTHRTEMLHCHSCDALYPAKDVAEAERDQCVECGASFKG